MVLLRVISIRFIEKLLNIDVNNIKRSLRITAEHSQRFRKTFVNVGKRIGIVERRSFKSISPKNFVKLWKGSVVDEEAFSEFLRKKMDVKMTQQFLGMIGKSVRVEHGKLSGIGKHMIERFYPEIFEASIKREPSL